jgi:hypothetical protein
MPVTRGEAGLDNELSAALFVDEAVVVTELEFSLLSVGGETVEGGLFDETEWLAFVVVVVADVVVEGCKMGSPGLLGNGYRRTTESRCSGGWLEGELL